MNTEQTSKNIFMYTKTNIINFELCQVRLILFNTNLITKNNISFVKNILK